MTCSERNFLASQCFYSLCIAKGMQLPQLTCDFMGERTSKAHDESWDSVLDRLVELSYRAADKMLEHDARTKEKD